MRYVSRNVFNNLRLNEVTNLENINKRIISMEILIIPN